MHNTYTDALETNLFRSNDIDAQQEMLWGEAFPCGETAKIDAIWLSKSKDLKK